MEHDEQLLSQLLQNTHEIIVLVDAAQRVIYRSPSATRISGWTNSETKDPAILRQTTHPDDVKKLDSYFKEAIENPGKTISTLIRTVHKDGHYMYMEGTACNLLHDEKVNAIVFNVRDATDRILKEQRLAEKRNKLIEREEQLQLYVEHSPAAIAMFDSDMNYLVVSRRWLQDYKLEGLNIIGRPHYEIFPEISPEWKTIHKRCLEGAVEKREEDHFVHADGSSSWLRWEVRPWHKADGTIGGIIIFAEDITERKKTEEKIAAGEERYRLILESISDGFIVLDNSWNFVYVNKMAEKMFGHPAHFFPGKNIWEVFPNAVNGPFHRAYKQAMETRQHVHFTDYSHYSKLWLEVNIYPSSAGLTIYFKDITEKIKAAENVKRSEETRGLIMRSALDAIVCINAEGNIIFWNAQAEQLFGWTEAEASGLPLKDTIIPPQYKEKHLAGFSRYREKGKGNVINNLIEITAINKSGHEFPVELFIVEVKSETEPFFCAYIRDITERKKKEQEIIRSNERLLRAQQVAHLGSVEVDFENNRILWSEEARKIYGIENDSRLDTPAGWFTSVHPDDMAYVKTMVAQTRQTNQSVSFYHRIIRKNGEIRHVLSNGKYEYFENGQPKSMHGIVHDITDLKKLELELLEQQQKEQLKITAAIIEAEEKERNAIGEELHDNVNQILTGIFLQLSRVKSRQLEAATIVDTSMEYLKKAIDENRKISKELITPEFVTTPLIAQLENLTAYMFSGTGISTFIDSGNFNEALLSEKQKLITYRVLQEQCTNITKYAMAAKVSIALHTGSAVFKMCIDDNGAGADPAAVSNGIGLRNIKSRLSLVNGTVHITTAPGSGFKLEVVFPLNS